MSCFHHKMKITTRIIFIIVIIITRGREEQLHQTLGKVINVHLSNDGSMSAKMYFFLKPKKEVVLDETKKMLYFMRQKNVSIFGSLVLDIYFQ